MALESRSDCLLRRIRVFCLKARHTYLFSSKKTGILWCESRSKSRRGVNSPMEWQKVEKKTKGMTQKVYRIIATIIIQKNSPCRRTQITLE